MISTKMTSQANSRVQIFLNAKEVIGELVEIMPGIRGNAVCSRGTPFYKVFFDLNAC